jgi:hypothetical protein
MDDKSNCIKIITKCYFKENIERIFLILTDQSYYIHINNGYLNNIKFKNNFNLDQLGSEFTMLYENVLPITMKVTSIINNLFKKKIKISSFNNIFIEFDLIHRLYWDSVENKTLYIKEVFIKRSIYPITREGLDYYKKEQKIIKKRIKKLLMKFNLGSVIEESISININIERLWKAVANWSIFVKIVPILGEKVFYNGEYDKENTMFLIRNKKIENNYKIIKSYKTEHLKEILIEKLNSPKESFHFKFVQIDEMKCFLSFKSKFLEEVSDIYINESIESKKKILLILKKQLEC